MRYPYLYTEGATISGVPESVMRGMSGREALSVYQQHCGLGAKSLEIQHAMTYNAGFSGYWFDFDQDVNGLKGLRYIGYQFSISQSKFSLVTGSSIVVMHYQAFSQAGVSETPSFYRITPTQSKRPITVTSVIWTTQSGKTFPSCVTLHGGGGLAPFPRTGLIIYPLPSGLAITIRPLEYGVTPLPRWFSKGGVQ